MSLSSATTFAIYDLFYSHQSNQMEVVKFAKWSLSKGLFMLEVFDKEDELRRLRGRSLVTAGFTVSYFWILGNFSNMFIKYTVLDRKSESPWKWRWKFIKTKWKTKHI